MPKTVRRVPGFELCAGGQKRAFAMWSNCVQELSVVLEIEKRKIEIDAKLSVAKFARKAPLDFSLASGRTSNASVAGFRMKRDLG